MLTISAPGREKNGATFSEGMAPSPRSSSEVTWRSARPWLVRTEIAIGVSCRFSRRFCAVTTISESCPPPPGASASGLCASAAGAAWSSDAASAGVASRVASTRQEAPSARRG
jgi:hypothetical protein